MRKYFIVVFLIVYVKVNFVHGIEENIDDINDKWDYFINRFDHFISTHTKSYMQEFDLILSQLNTKISSTCNVILKEFVEKASKEEWAARSK